MAVSAGIRNLPLLVLLAMLWGTAFMFIKIGVETIPPLSLAAGRIVLGLGVLWAIAAWRGEALPRGGRIWLHFTLVGLSGNALPFFLIAWGEVTIESGLAAILMATAPLAALLMAHVFIADERLNLNKFAGVALGFSGVLLVVGVEALTSLGRDVWGQLAVIGGAMGYATSAIFARALPPMPVAVKGTATLICASAILVPLALIADRPWELEPSPESAVSLVVLGIFPSAMALLIYFRLVTTVGAAYTVSNNYMVPIFGVLAGALVLDERLGWRAFAALALALAGIALSQMPPFRRARRRRRA